MYNLFLSAGAVGTRETAAGEKEVAVEDDDEEEGDATL